MLVWTLESHVRVLGAKHHPDGVRYRSPLDLPAYSGGARTRQWNLDPIDEEYFVTDLEQAARLSWTSWE